MRVDTGRLRVVAAQSAPSTEPAPPISGDATARDRSPNLEEDTGLGADGFDSPGPYIRAQRERKGMSLDELAVVTKIPRAQLELLEADRYGELPGMVFAKGFLRCCARELELDPDTVLGLLYERERAQLQARRRDPADKKPEPRLPAANSKRAAGRGVGRGAGRAPQRASLLEQIQARVTQWLGQIPSAKILLWIVVALLVALIVFIAFTLASSQAQTLMIQS